MKKRISATLLALCCAFLLALPASAAGSITQSEVEKKLESAESRWPNGDVYDDSTVLASECYAFTRELFYYVFGTQLPAVRTSDARFYSRANYIDHVEEIGHLSSGYSVSELKALLLKAKPGDTLIAANRSATHHVIIRSVKSDGSGIYVYDANWNHRMGIRTNALWKASDIQSARNYAVTLYRYVNYDTGSADGTEKETRAASPWEVGKEPTRVLYYKSPLITGSDVKWLQQALNIVNNTNLTVDGKFGPATKTAVRSFQSQYGLDVDGKAGPATRGKLISLLNAKGYYAP